LALARLLAPKKDRDLLGQNEFEVQDRIHPIGIKAIQTALAKRKKGVPELQRDLSELPRIGPLSTLAEQKLSPWF